MSAQSAASQLLMRETLMRINVRLTKGQLGAYKYRPGGRMITGAHVILFVSDADAARVFLRDVLGLPSVDAGAGWLIFALPSAELAAHPTDGDSTHQLYLMCDDLHTTVADLRAKGVEFLDEPSEHDWGTLITLQVPGGGALGLYQPRHASPLAVSHR
jgi:catechol 2,3-dioxygenase-like lactoylglutathione lyase family enzyme